MTWFYPQPKNTLAGGYSLVEVLVAVSVLLIGIAGPLTIASRGMQVSDSAQLQTTAFFLAQEGIELVMALRANDGLAQLDDRSNGGSKSLSWDWTKTINLKGCNTPSGQNRRCEFGLDRRYLKNPATYPMQNCRGNTNTSNCDLYLKDISPNNTQFYLHDSTGNKTPFNRVITVEDLGNNAVRVTSAVTYRARAQVLGGNKTEVSETVLYDIYD